MGDQPDGEQYKVNQILGSNVAMGAGARTEVHYHYASRPNNPATPYLAPALPPHHIPREAELSELYHLLVECAEDVAVTALRGMGGIGKTTLAIAFCHGSRVIEHFPDGILWTSLGPSGDVLRAQATWGDALSVPLNDLPDAETRAARLRTILHPKCCLLVIDDVWDSDVLPYLQVGGPQCATLVTTRERKIAQKVGIARDLDVLIPEQAVAILGAWAGRMQDEQGAVAGELARRLGYLPLALALAGAQAQDGKSWDKLLGALRSTQGDLTLLDLDDPKVRDESLALTFKLSVDRLEQPLPERFAILGVFAAGRDAPFDRAAAAAVWECSEDDAEQSLGRLVRASLLDRAETAIHLDPHYYTQHLLLGDYARSLLTEHARQAATARHAAHYLELARRSENEWRVADASIPQMRVAWERAASNGDSQLLFVWATTTSNLLFRRGYLEDSQRLTEAALRILPSDKYEELGWCHNRLGYIAVTLDELPTAMEHFEQCLAIHVKQRNSAGHSIALTNLAYALRRQGDFVGALAKYEECLALARSLKEDTRPLIGVLNNIGEIHMLLEDPEAAMPYIWESFNLALNGNDWDGVAPALNNLGYILLKKGDYDRALAAFTRVLEIVRQVGDLHGEALILNNLAGIHAEAGQLIKAIKLIFSFR